MACEDGVFNTWPGFPKRQAGGSSVNEHGITVSAPCESTNYGVTIEKSKSVASFGPQGEYLVTKYQLNCANQRRPKGSTRKNTIEDAMKEANAFLKKRVGKGAAGNPLDKGGIHDMTGEYCASQVPAEPEPVADTEPKGILETIASFFENGVPADAPPPEERTMSEDEKAQIEEHIRNMDIDFKEEMRNNGVTLTKDGNNAWEEIRNAVRDGTLPLRNYNNDFLRGKLEQEGYFTQSEPEEPMRFGDQLVTPSKPPQEDFGGKVKPPAQPPMGGPIQFDKAGRPMDIPIEPTRGGIGEMMGGFIDMMFPPALPHEEEEQRLREIAEQEAALSPEDPEEAARKARAKDIEKTDERFAQAHGNIEEQGEREWADVRTKYLDVGNFDYAKAVQEIIERNKIPDPIDCVVDVAPWDEQGWVDNCDTHGVWVRARQRPTKMTPPQVRRETVSSIIPNYRTIC